MSAAPCQAQRIPADMALQMQDALSQDVAEFGDQSRVRDAGPNAQATVLGPPFGQLGNSRQVEDHSRADAVESTAGYFG